MATTNFSNDFLPAFPYLSLANAKPTSVATTGYNCIAWTYGRDDVWCQPDPTGTYFWPVTNADNTLDAFIELFQSIGYDRCDNDSLEPGFQKIAIYTLGGRPQHAARQLPSGAWTSKLGSDIDIEHATLDCLNGPSYGKAEVIMERPI